MLPPACAPPLPACLPACLPASCLCAPLLRCQSLFPLDNCGNSHTCLVATVTPATCRTYCFLLSLLPSLSPSCAETRAHACTLARATVQDKAGFIQESAGELVNQGRGMMDTWGLQMDSE